MQGIFFQLRRSQVHGLIEVKNARRNVSVIFELFNDSCNSLYLQLPIVQVRIVSFYLQLPTLVCLTQYGLYVQLYVQLPIRSTTYTFNYLYVQLPIRSTTYTYNYLYLQLVKYTILRQCHFIYSYLHQSVSLSTACLFDYMKK